MIFGGDGFYTGIDPDNSNRIVEEYANGAVSGTIDGGKTWQSYSPGLTAPQFATPLQVDPGNADHLIIAGREVDETQYVYQGHCYPDPSIPWAACELIDNWNTVFDLGHDPQVGKDRSDRLQLTCAATTRTPASVVRAASAARRPSATGSPPTSAATHPRSSTPATAGTSPRRRACRTAGSRPSASTRATRLERPCT